MGSPSRGWMADKKSSKPCSLVVSGRARCVRQRGQDLDMPSSPPYQASTQLLQPTIFLQQRANMTGGVIGDWQMLHLNVSLNLQWRATGIFVSLFISKRSCISSRIRVTSFVRDARPEVTVCFLAGMKSSSESDALVSWG